jgi:methyl-accepting chemotaxis protein
MDGLQGVSSEILLGIREISAGVQEVTGSMVTLQELFSESVEAVDRIEDNLKRFSI